MNHVFYAVSTGPAGGKFLTSEAIEVLRGCESIFYPAAASNEKSAALECIREAVNLEGKDLRKIIFPMGQDEARNGFIYERAAEEACRALLKGSAAFVCIGDVCVYSTAAAVAEKVKKRGFETRFVAGVTSFCAAACACRLDLAEKDEPIAIIPGDACFKKGEIARALDERGTKIFMKCARHLKEIIAAAKAAGLIGSSYLVFKAGSAQEKIFCGEEICAVDFDEEKSWYMSVLIVKGSARR